MKFKLIISFLIPLLWFGCKKENIKQFVMGGCIPQTIILEHPLIGDEDNYVYENNKLISYGISKIDYKDGLVSSISVGSNRYEEYFYNELCQVIKSIQHRRDDPEVGFMIVDEKEYKYNDNQIVEIIDLDDKTIEFITYYNGTKNIDSMKTINENMELIHLKVLQYDQFNNPQKNLLIPRFNYPWWIERGFENNVIRKIDMIFETPRRTFIWINDIKYNEFDYPIEINTTREDSNFSSKTIITYTNCQ